MLYRNLSSYLREKYGKRLSKICIDGGFTCPNRDGTAGEGGCIYCGERGAGEHIDPTRSIREQVATGLAGGDRDDGYIVYFQNFTNTYAPVEILRERYDAAVFDPRIRILAVGTRPDCVSDEIADLLASYTDRVDVWVELGLQTASDATAKVINRGYETECFRRAVEILSARNIPTVAHVMVGLPGEGRSQALDTVRFISKCGVWGVKIHSTYVMEGTRLAEMYRRGEYQPISMPEYAAIAAECIALLPPDTVVHRITGDCPRGLLVAPEWNGDKNAVISAIRDNIVTRGLSQGALWGK